MRVLLLLPLAACNVDSLSTNGELGHLSFSLSSAWYLDPTQLTDVDIVTGHEQTIGVELTEDGRERADGDAGAIEYVMSPSTGVTFAESDDDSDSEEAPPLAVTVTEPGDYTLEARLGGETFDRIQLGFDAPALIEVAGFVRDPWAEEFSRMVSMDPVQVLEGSQFAWLPIPLAEGGERLAGDIATSMAAEPMTAVVPADNVTHVNEDEVFGASAPSLYFVEPGEVTVTLADTVNTVEAPLHFIVE